MGCIYLARNTVNGKGYVGKTAKLLEERMYEHEKSAGDRSHYAFHRAIRKYRFESFEWIVLYEDDDNDRDWMDWWEMKFIRELGTKLPGGYNMTDGGQGGAQFFGPHLIQTRKKMSLSHTGKTQTEETKLKKSMALRGRPLLEGTKQKISQSRKGKKYPKLSEALRNRPPISEEVRAKMSASQTGRKHSEESKKKMSLVQRGRKKPAISEHNKRLKTGVPNPKVSEANAKRQWSDESKKKLSQTNTGRKRSEDSRKKISEGLMGHVVSQETREKIRQSLLARRKKDV